MRMLCKKSWQLWPQTAIQLISKTTLLVYCIFGSHARHNFGGQVVRSNPPSEYKWIQTSFTYSIMLGWGSAAIQTAHAQYRPCRRKACQIKVYSITHLCEQQNSAAILSTVILISCCLCLHHRHACLYGNEKPIILFLGWILVWPYTWINEGERVLLQLMGSSDCTAGEREQAVQNNLAVDTRNRK